MFLQRIKKTFKNRFLFWVIPFGSYVFGCAFVSNMTNRTIRSPDVYNTSEYGFSQGIVTSAPRTIYFSGIVGWDQKRRLREPNDFEAQTIQIFENLKRLLESENATLNDVLRLEVFIVAIDPTKLKTYSKVVSEIFDSGHKPASTVVGVQALAREELTIEIQATASAR
ncbi:RidA family protein [Leptospira adleri]|uniref:RidA family protein n=1 Tax=Leptospira adleri TaxID=2023186 RepID=UPI001082BE6B|nr:RidA family protein [Leptospira adleri]TGM53370.1 RidA family protein [Leptospira adleri]